MERRAFIKALFIGAGVAVAAAPARALNFVAPLAPADHGPELTPQSGVATSEDMERAQIEKAWYYRRPYYGWRGVRRRHWRRVRRRVYRRHYYYY